MFVIKHPQILLLISAMSRNYCSVRGITFILRDSFVQFTCTGVKFLYRWSKRLKCNLKGFFFFFNQILGLQNSRGLPNHANTILNGSNPFAWQTKKQTTPLRSLLFTPYGLLFSMILIFKTPTILIFDFIRLNIFHGGYGIVKTCY